MEDAIFDNYNSLQLTKFLFQGENTGIIAAKNSNNSFIDIGMYADRGSNVLIKNVEINHVVYNCLVIKGSNQSSTWDASSANKDAKRIFDADLLYALSRSEDVREKYYEPGIYSKLLPILTKWNNAINSNGQVTYTDTDKEHALGEVIKLAESKGITNASDFVHKAFDYLKDANLPAPKTVFGINDPSNWGYAIVCGVQPTFSFSVIVTTRYFYKKSPSSNRKIILGFIIALILAQGGFSLILQYPYDFQWLSLQSVVIGIMWFFGLFAATKVRKWLGAWLTVRRVVKQSEKNNRSKHAK